VSIDWIYLAQDGGPMADNNKRVNGPSGSVKGGELLEQVRDYQFVKGENSPWSSLPDACNSITSQLILNQSSQDLCVQTTTWLPAGSFFPLLQFTNGLIHRVPGVGSALTLIQLCYKSKS
jgi:hypothetical protein